MSCWLRYCATSRKIAVLIPEGAIGFITDLILPTAQSLGVDSASNGNDYEEYLLWGGVGIMAADALG